MKNFIIKTLALISIVSLSYAAEAPPQAPQQVVDRLIKQKIDEINQAYAKQGSMALPGYKEREIRNVQEFYPWYEANLNALRSRFPHYEIAGNLDYFMNLNEMTNVVRAKFKEMYRNGQIITQQEFEKQDRNNWFPTPDLPKRQDLPRVWGAQYLARKFKEDNRTGFRTPEYVIVVDDLNRIQVKLRLTDQCLPQTNEIQNGAFYAKRIDGEGVARKTTIQGIIGYGYTDYSAANNILRGKDGILYPVDTEYKSFYDGSPQNYIFKNLNLEKGSPRMMCEYFYNRFKLLNPEIQDERTIEFSVLD